MVLSLLLDSDRLVCRMVCVVLMWWVLVIVYMDVVFGVLFVSGVLWSWFGWVLVVDCFLLRLLCIFGWIVFLLVIS